MSSQDPPSMSPLVKHLCKIRKHLRSHRQSEAYVLQAQVEILLRSCKILQDSY